MNKHEARILAVLVFTILIIVFLSSCGSPDTKRIEEDRFMAVETYEDSVIYVDKRTGVEYASYNGNLAVMFDSYGNPLVWPAFDAREDRVPYADR